MVNTWLSLLDDTLRALASSLIFSSWLRYGRSDVIYSSIRIFMLSNSPSSYFTLRYLSDFISSEAISPICCFISTPTLYEKFSYDTRAIIRSEKYQEVFPSIKLAPDKQNLTGWNLETSKQVAYFGAGVGG